MFGRQSKVALLLVALTASVDASLRHPVIVSKFFGFPAKLLFHSFIKNTLPKNYDDLSAKEKMGHLWERCTADTSSEEFASNAEALGIMILNMNDVFDHCSDERPWRGKKAIHSRGFVGKAKFTAAAGTPYTGIWKGCPNVLIRFAPGANPEPIGSLLSGISAKFLIDGKQSVNYLSLRRSSSFRGGPEKTFRRWFNGDQSNVPAPLPVPLKFFLLPKFGTTSREPNHLGTADFANTDHTGKTEKDPKVPFEVLWTPNKSLDQVSYQNLDTIAPGTKLYDVYAKEKDVSSPKKLIGTITSTSKMTTSKYGDTKLFFQHIRRDEDLKKLGLKCPYKPAQEQEFNIDPKLD